MKGKITIVIFFLVLILGSCRMNRHENPHQLTLYCAAGLTDIITELNASFCQKNECSIKLNLASSGTLARQLAQGGQADIFISASRQWADYADSLGLFSQRKPLCRNQLVFIAPLDRAADSIDFQTGEAPELEGYLSMGDPEHVPAGQYAREALIRLGWWPEMEKKILPAKDVRSALLPVELGECALGVVYRSDALASKKVRILGILPDSTHSPIVFYALLSPSASPLAAAYYAMLTDIHYQESWSRYGLTMTNPN